MCIRDSFKGVKMGDVTGNANTGFNGSVSRNGNPEMMMLADENVYNRGDELSIPVFLEKKSKIAGYQFTIKFDQEKLEFEDILSGISNIGPENLGLIKANEGYISFSWNSNKDIDILQSDVLFTLKFKALSKGQLSTSIHINSAITTAEAYDAVLDNICLLYTSPSPRDRTRSRMPSSA